MKINVRFLFLIFTAGLLTGNQDVKNTKATISDFPVESLEKINTGDLVLRNGRGLVSEFFRNTSHEKKYSHAGIASRENGIIWVYHILGTPGTKGIQKVKLEEFCNSIENSGFAVFKYEIGSLEKEMLLKYFNNDFNHVIFDEKFNLETDDELYCSELIYKAVNYATGNKNLIPVSKFREQPYISIDNLYLNNIAKPVFNFKY